MCIKLQKNQEKLLCFSWLDVLNIFACLLSNELYLHVFRWHMHSVNDRDDVVHEKVINMLHTTLNRMMVHMIHL